MHRLDGSDGPKGRAEVAGSGGEGQVADVQGRAALEGGDLRVGRVVVRPVPVQLGLGGVGEEEVGGGGRRGEDVLGWSSGGGGCVGGGVHRRFEKADAKYICYVTCYASALIHVASQPAETSGQRREGHGTRHACMSTTAATTMVGC